MASEYPGIKKEETKITIEFCFPGGASHSSVEIPLVLDLGIYGEVLGIEALSCCWHAGPNLLAGFDYAATEAAGVRLSYDGEADAMYIKIDDGRCLDQRSVDGKFFLDSNGRLIGIEAQLA